MAADRWQRINGLFADALRASGILSKRGEHSAALGFGRKALAIRESLVALDARNARYAFLLGANWTDLGDAHTASGERAAAVADYGKAVAILEPMAARDPVNVLKRRALGTAAARLEKARGSATARVERAFR